MPGVAMLDRKRVMIERKMLFAIRVWLATTDHFTKLCCEMRIISSRDSSKPFLLGFT
jgi:hypothetical protein